jgi:UDP-glucose 4-epimerase
MKDPHILVTGGAGFIGSHLCDRLLAEEATVTAIDDLSLGCLEHLTAARENPRFSFVQIDILNWRDLDKIFAEGKFNSVFHLAANSDIRKGGREADRDLNLTFLTTFRVLDAMRKFKVRDLVFASSSAIYGEVEEEIGEDHGPLQPVSFYGAAKNAAESYISAFVHQFDMRTWIFRFPNVVGSRLTHGVVHDFIRQLQSDPTRLTVLGDGEQLKPFLHVDDLIDAMILAKNRLLDPINCLNIAAETRTSVRRIAEIVVEEMGLKDVAFRFTGGAGGWKGDIPRYQYDLARIKSLGWQPRYTSDQAIRLAVRQTLASNRQF